MPPFSFLHTGLHTRGQNVLLSCTYMRRRFCLPLQRCGYMFPQALPQHTGIAGRGALSPGRPASNLACLWKELLSQMPRTCILWVIFQFISHWH